MEQSVQIGDKEARLWTLIERWKHLMIRLQLTRLSFRGIMMHKKQSNKLQLISDLIINTKGNRFRKTQTLSSMFAAVTAKFKR